jgi:glycosyltransferase 2 family protein
MAFPSSASGPTDGRLMKRFFEFVWPGLGLAAVIISIWLLHQQFRGNAVAPEVWADLKAISPGQYGLVVAATLIAYAALAWYDRIALLHLGIRYISWTFIALCSFTTYALAHNIGASVFSGAMVRYRAYSTKGLTATQIALLVGFCSLTFGLGVLLLGGLLLVAYPWQLQRLAGMLPRLLTEPATARVIGLICLGLVLAYVAGSIFNLKPLIIGKLRIKYPRPGIALRQFIAAPMEILGAAAIIYFALPQQGNPGYFVVLGVFMASFSAALASEAPGGLGVFELLFIKAMPAMAQHKVLTALLVFRFFYLVLPLIFASIVVVVFERGKLQEALSQAKKAEAGKSVAQREKSERGPSPADVS